MTMDGTSKAELWYPVTGPAIQGLQNKTLDSDRGERQGLPGSVTVYTSPTPLTDSSTRRFLDDGRNFRKFRLTGRGGTMREYASVSPLVWIGKTGKALRGHMEAQILQHYLISSPHSNSIGIYYLPFSYILNDTGLSEKGALKGLQRLSEVSFMGYDRDSEVVFVYEMAKWQIGESLHPNDKQVKGIQSLYDNLPENPFLSKFFDLYADRFHLKNRRGSEGASMDLRSTETETETETEVKIEELARSSEKTARSSQRRGLSDDEWLSRLKADAAYAHIDFPQELAKMDQWLKLPKNSRRKKTRQFILNWLNKIDKPVAIQAKKRTSYLAY